MVEKQIPLIDIEPFVTGSIHDKKRVASQVAQACESIGFLRIAGHGISENTLKEVLEVGTEFFDLPLEEKMKIATPTKFLRGYLKLGSDSVSNTLEQVPPPDLREIFQIGRLHYCTDDEYYSSPVGSFFFAPNQWPQLPAKFRQVMTNYYLKMEKLAVVLMRIFALALELPEHFFDDKIDKHTSDLCIFNYPEQLNSPLPGQLRAGPHTDFGSLSIVYQNNAPGGLQVLNEDRIWIDVKTVVGTFAVNIGDLMARWTNDRWKSTLHRVVNPPLEVATSSRRQSVAFFHQPNYDALITCLESCCSVDNPPKYKSVTSGEHVYNKIQKTLRL